MFYSIEMILKEQVLTKAHREVPPMTKRFVRGAAFLDPDMWKNKEFRRAAERLMDVALEEMVKFGRADGLQAKSFQ